MLKGQTHKGHTNRKRPGRHAKSPNKRVTQKRYRGQGRI